MSNSKILFVGDYKDPLIIQIAELLCDKYSDEYDLLFSGYNLSYITKDSPLRKVCKPCGLGAKKLLYYQNTAQFAIITSLAPRYLKTKSNQKIIFFLRDFDKECFAGCIGDIDTLVTDSEKVERTFRRCFDSVDVVLCDEEEVDRKLASIVSAMGIEENRKCEGEDILVVSSSTSRDIFKDSYGAGHFLNRIVKEDSGNVILLQDSWRDSCASTNIAFDASLRTISILEHFDGLILYDNMQSKHAFEKFLEESRISMKDVESMLFEDYPLWMMEREFGRANWDADTSDYSKYRVLMEEAYEKYNCKDILVSIIICHYNTPMTLLERSVSSALHSGHENVEVLVVDDGSKENVNVELCRRINDKRMKYFRKDNEGLGLARNYGVRKAQGDFVFYLDSDDTIHAGGLPCLVAHAIFFGLDLVIGKRVLCDERGVPYSESLRHLAGNTFMCYYANLDNAEVYADVMVNNLLIKRKRLFDEDIWFTQGLYEDVEYSPQLYSRLEEYHYVNVMIHDWYQYGSNTTISSSSTINNFLQRMEKEENAWEYIPERVKTGRLSSILSGDFNLYLATFFAFSEEDRLVIWKEMKRFVEARKQYVRLSVLSEKVKELTRAILGNSYGQFEYVIDRYYAERRNAGERFDDYIVTTHYHLYVACLYAIKSERKSRLFLCQSYTPFDTNLVYRIRKSGVFDSVTTFIFGDAVGKMFEQLKLRPGEESSIIPDCLYNRYKDVFKKCDTKMDTVYIFSDTLPYWYYVEREFDHIIKLEDAYNSFDREVNTHKLTGIWAGIRDYEGRCYPKMFFESKKISRIITSSRPEGIPEHFYSKIKIDDTKQIDRKYREQIKEVMLYIYSVDPHVFTEDTTLVLTQPLALFGYCSEKEQKKLVKKMCEMNKDSKILIKPHPADRMNYKKLGQPILPRSVPMEVYNYLDVRIKRVICFASSAIETVEIAEEKKNLFKLHDFSFDDVVEAIQQIIAVPPKKKTLKQKIRSKLFR